MTDDHLHERIRAARPIVTFPPEFQREIWGRIESKELNAPLLVRLLRSVESPVPATALALSTALLGGLLASWNGHRTAARDSHASYVQSVSPFSSAQRSLAR